MSTQEKTGKSWGKEKEDLKLKFELITSKYCLFEGNEPGAVSEKLRLRFAKTKKELHDIIAAL
jgi:phage anti-repressor protein